MSDSEQTNQEGAPGAAQDQGTNSADRLRAGAQKARETFEKVADPALRAGAAMKASGEKVVEGNKTIGLRLIDQAEQNARQAFAAMRAAAGATDLSDVMRIQGEYLREQTQRNMAQAREVGELIMQFGRDAVSPMRGSSDPK